MAKKILFIHTKLSGGGAEKVIMNIYNSIDDTNFQKKYISLCDNINTEEFCGLGATSVFRSWLKLQKFIKEYNPDMVFSTMIHVALLINILRIINNFGFIHITRMAASVTNPFVSYYDRIIRWSFVKTIRKNELIICQTQQMQEMFMLNYGIKKQNLLVVRNFLDTETIDRLKDQLEIVEKDKKFKIISLGRIDRIKGFEYGVKALKELHTQGFDFDYRIYGDIVHKDYYQQLKDLIVFLGLENNVYLCDKVDNPYPYLKGADLLLLSSLSEGFPNVVIESLYLGVPVVATDCSDFHGIIEEGINGYIVPTKTIKPLSDAIKKGMQLPKNSFTFRYRNYDYNSFFKEIINRSKERI